MAASRTVPLPKDTAAACHVPTERASSAWVGAWRAISRRTSAVSRTAAPRSISEPSLVSRPVRPGPDVHGQGRVPLGRLLHRRPHGDHGLFGLALGPLE